MNTVVKVYNPLHIGNVIKLDSRKYALYMYMYVMTVLTRSDLPIVNVSLATNGSTACNTTTNELIVFFQKFTSRHNNLNLLIAGYNINKRMRHIFMEPCLIRF